MSKEFIRQETRRHLKLGRKRKKMRKWRRPKGRDSKMRLQRKSYPASPSIGYRTAKQTRGKIHGKSLILVRNLNDLKKINKNSVALLAKIGAKKKFEIIKNAQENKIKILNVNGGKNET